MGSRLRPAARIRDRLRLFIEAAKDAGDELQEPPVRLVEGLDSYGDMHDFERELVHAEIDPRDVISEAGVTRPFDWAIDL